MSKILFIILMLILFSCKKGLQNERLIINNDNVFLGQPVEIKFENINYKPFYLLLRSDQLAYEIKRNRLVVHIFDGKDSLKVTETLISTLPFFNNENEENEYNSQQEILKQNLFRKTSICGVLKTNESLVIKTIFNNYEKDDTRNIEYNMSLDNTKSYTLQFSYTSDSTFVKQIISKKLLDSLHQHNIKIFHGTIYSNKVPLELKQ